MHMQKTNILLLQRVLLPYHVLKLQVSCSKKVWCSLRKTASEKRARWTVEEIPPWAFGIILPHITKSWFFFKLSSIFLIFLLPRISYTHTTTWAISPPSWLSHIPYGTVLGLWILQSHLNLNSLGWKKQLEGRCKQGWT